MLLAEDLLHGAVAGLRLEVALNNPVFRHADMRLFHRLHEAGQSPRAGVALQRARDHADFAVTAFNQVTSGDIPALEGVIDHRIGKVGFGFAPVHHHHRNMAVLFQHAQDGIRIFRTHHQQTVDAFLRHHRQIGTLFFRVVPGVAEDQSIALLETALFHGLNNFSEIGGFATGRQQANRFCMIDFQAAGHRARRVVQLFNRRPYRITRLFGNETGFVNYM